MRLCVSSCGSPSKRVKIVGSGKHMGLGVGDPCTQILSCAVCPPALWLWASYLTFPSFNFLISDLGLNTTEQLDDALKLFYLKRRDSGLRASSQRRFGGAPPASVFEYWKEPPGMELGLREPQWITDTDVLCICFWAWKLETELTPVGFWCTFYILAWKAVHLSVFLLGSEWLIKISGFLAGF